MWVPGRAEFNSQTDLTLFGFCHYFLGQILSFQSKTSYNWVLPTTRIQGKGETGKNSHMLVFENVTWKFRNSFYLVIWDVSIWICHEQCSHGHPEHVSSHIQVLLFLRYISRRIFESIFFFTFHSETTSRCFPKWLQHFLKWFYHLKSHWHCNIQRSIVYEILKLENSPNIYLERNRYL